MFQLTPWSLLPLVSAALAVRTYALIRMRPRVPGTQALQALTVLVIFWSGCVLVEISVTDLRARTTAVQLGYLAELLMPVTWFALAFCYIQRQMRLSLLTLNALCCVPLVSIGLAITNPWHALVWRELLPPAESAAGALLPSFGAWFMVQLVISGVMVVVATTILAYALAQASRQARPVAAVVLAPLLVATAGAVSVSAYNPLPGVDSTPIGFAAALLLLHQDVLRRGVLETIPLLRDRVLEKLIEGVVVVNQDGRIIEINSAAVALLQVGRNVLSSARIDSYLDGFSLDGLMRSGSESMEVVLGTRTYDVTGSLLDGANPASDVVLVFRDVTTRRETERALRTAQYQLEHLAHTDPLTGLFNRRYFMMRLKEETQRSARHQTMLSVLLMDLDHFKHINDTHGHDAGDRVLQAVARAAAEITRTSDVMARIGGEEFALLLPETDREGAMHLADRMREAVQATTIRTAEGRTVSVTASIGVATLTAYGGEPREALTLADSALYEAKRAGRNAIRLARSA